jgi:hypothetical protein
VKEPAAEKEKPAEITKTIEADHVLNKWENEDESEVV